MHPRLRLETTPDRILDATLGAITIGLVPVMGTLHAGHLALVRRSVLENDETVVALLAREGAGPELDDLAARDLREVGAHIVYQPDDAAIDRSAIATVLAVPGLSDRFEGEFRPGSMERTTLLIVILINQLQPTRTYIGEKHLQQLAVLQRVHDDLSLSGEIVPCPIVRDPDGVPLSTYNSGLTEADRVASRAVPDALFAMQQAVIRGDTDPASVRAVGEAIVAAHGPALQVDYLAIVDPATFAPVTRIQPGDRAIIAATVEGVRLLDNVHLEPGETGSTDS